MNRFPGHPCSVSAEVRRLMVGRDAREAAIFMSYREGNDRYGVPTRIQVEDATAYYEEYDAPHAVLLDDKGDEIPF